MRGGMRGRGVRKGGGNRREGVVLPRRDQASYFPPPSPPLLFPSLLPPPPSPTPFPSPLLPPSLFLFVDVVCDFLEVGREVGGERRGGGGEHEDNPLPTRENEHENGIWLNLIFTLLICLEIHE